MKRFTYLDLVKELLPESERQDFEDTYTNPIQKSIKIITKKISQEEIQKEDKSLTFFDVPFTQNNQPLHDIVFVSKEEKGGLGNHRLHKRGFFYVQEMSAGVPVQTMDIKENEVVLDMCSAPWGKSLQLLDKAPWSSIILSNEVNPQRRKALLSNLERCGNEQIAILGYDGRKLGDLFFEQCDKVLLDAPCSGEWMQYKSDFKIFSWNEKEVKKIATLQEELLISWLKALKIWWELTYSTCTTNTLENEGVLKKIWEQYGDAIEFLPVRIDQKSQGIPQRREEIYPEEITHTCARFRPHKQHTWWFFVAKIRKKKSIESIQHTPSLENSIWDYQEEKNQEIWEFLHEHFGIQETDSPHLCFVESQLTIQVVPKNYLPLLQKHLFREQLWMPILKKLNNKYLPLDGLAVIFGSKATKNVLQLTTDEIKEFVDQQRISKEISFSEKYLLVTWKHKGIGIYVRK